MASLQKRVVKGKEYWSIVESKRINGKPRPVVIEYIGNTKKLFQRLQNSSGEKDALTNCTLKSYSHGDSYSLMKIADRLGITDILDLYFKPQSRDGVKRSTSLLLAAIHRACSPGSKNEFEGWFRTSTLSCELDIKPELMTSRHFWEQMDGITQEQLQQAEDAISKKILHSYDIGLDKLALDYTNYFTFISTHNTRNKLAKRGRNKQKRHDLRQCSLAIVTSKEAGIPLFSHVYEGNLNDQTEFSRYLPMLEKRVPDYNPEEITLIFDGGSNTKENLAALKSHYICSFSLSYCKVLYNIDVESYQTVEINAHPVRYHRTQQNIWGQKRTCILTFSSRLYCGQVQELEKDLEKAARSLEELIVKISSTSRMDKSEKGILEKAEKLLKKKYLKDIIAVEVDEGKLKYKEDDQKKQEIIHQYFGKKLTITDRDEWSTQEILKAYYDQDCIEKIFRDTKNVEHFSLRPIYHFTDQKIRVHIFLCLLGLTLTAVLQKELKNRDIHISKNELMERLSQVRQCWVKEKGTNKIAKILEEMDTQQSILWEIITGL